jgi:UDP-glucuronate 4-epimerase
VGPAGHGLFLFTRAIMEGRPIDVFNHGKMQRDFTYIDDIAEGVVRVLDRPAAPDPAFVKDRPDPATSWAPYRVYNIGNHQPVELMAYIEAGGSARPQGGKELPAPAGRRRAGDLCRHGRAARDATGFAPATPVREGVRRFVEWYRGYYRA